MQYNNMYISISNKINLPIMDNDLKVETLTME